MSLSKPDGMPFEVVRFDHSPWEVHVLNEDLDLLVQEGNPETVGVKSSADPMRIWWVSSQNKAKKLLRGPEKGLSFAHEAPVSPDYRYVVVQQWQDKPDPKERIKLLYMLDRQTGKTALVNGPEKDLSVVRWKQTDAGLRAVAVTNRWRLDDKDISELYLIDPSTGMLERQETGDARFEIDNLVSPDGKRRVRIDKNEIVVTDVEDGKQHRLHFQEEDPPYLDIGCLEWITPRYLKFNGQRLALIDVTTMKMSIPAPAQRRTLASLSYKFSADLRWVMYQGEGVDGEALFLAPVELPKD